MAQLLFLLCFLFLPLQGFALTLGDEFKKAEIGDFVVFEHQKLITLLRIAEKDEKTLGIEEITAPRNTIDPKTISWKDWVSKGAEHHTSWIVTNFDPQTYKVQSTISIDSHEPVDTAALFQFLPTLLNLELRNVPQDERKRIGPPPMGDEPDFRKLWLPQVVFEGKIIHPEFQVCTTKWPADGSELTGKTIYLYIPHSKECLSYFPYWVEVSGKFHNVKLRVIDSGKNLTFSRQTAHL
jgi:hypothetical protein